MGSTRTRERVELALEAAGIGLWELDLTSGTLHWDEAHERLAGLEPGTFGGRREDFFALVHPDDVPRIEDASAAAVDGGEFGGAYRVMLPDGGIRWLEGKGTMFRSDDGHRIAFGITHDVTDRRRLEEDLRQAQKLQAVGQLAGGIAHDFNNLLTAVSGYAGLLAGRADLPPDALGQIDGIAAAADRAAELTQQLLAFSRRQTLLPDVIDPTALVRRAAPMLRRVVGEHIGFELDTRDDVRCVFADAGQLEQILMHLVVNAAQAMPRGGVLTVSTEPDGEEVAISVRDTGCGMDEETAGRAFEPFFTTRPGGSGLGLATVHGIARQSGGTARLTSTPGKGTCVTVSLPAVDAEPAAPDAAEPGAADTVLLVDDNAVVRDVVADMLEHEGYAVTVAETPAHAIDLVEHGARPDILLTDVVMPDIGGPELAKRLTELHPSLRTVLTSGYSEHGLLDDAAALRPVFLHKPFSAEKLGRALRSAVR